MISDRFSDELISLQGRLSPHAPAGFLVVPVAASEPAQASPLQCLYQQMYQQAIQVQNAPKSRDLFAVMN
jgi:hypothetical protein